MSTVKSAAALRYQPSFEVREKDEDDTERTLTETMRKIQETTYADSGQALRSVHAKSHGLLVGRLEVLPDLPPELAQGLYAQPASWPVVLRFSTNPGDVLDDAVSTPRGLALKLIGVPGERLPGSVGDVTQDYVLVDGPAFLKKDAKSFASSLKTLAATTDKAEGGKKALSAVLRGTEKVIEALGGKSPAIIGMGGHAATHPLGETFYSQVPILHGEFMAKVALRPVAPELAALKDAPIELKDRPNALREEIADYFRAHGATWELCVQLCTDLDAMPIEDAKTPWPEDASPYRAVARITAAPQEAWNDARAKTIDDGLSFSPWHGVAAHRPIGSVMRVRRAAYETARRFRAERNGQAVAEPKSIDDLRL